VVVVAPVQAANRQASSANEESRREVIGAG
jgi:hypothetical protein